MKKARILSAALAAAMVFSMAACSSDSGSTSSSSTSSDDSSTTASADDSTAADDSSDTASSDITLDGSWPEETIKLGFIGYDSTSEQQVAIQEYYDYLSEYFNIEIMYSEDLADADEELQFIDNCAAAGCKGIIGYYNEAKEQSAIRAADNGMFYWGGFGGDTDAYNAVKDNEYYVGGYTLGDAEYEAGRSMALALADQGKEKIVLCSGGASMGVTMFVNRKAGFEAGVEEANANGANMEIVYEVEGWPGTDAFTAAQTSVMDMDIDAIASTFDVAMWFQLVSESDKADTLSLACVGNVTDTYYGFVNSGLVTCIIYDSTEVAFGNPIPMLLQAITGEKFVNEDGSAPLIAIERWTITTADQFDAIYDLHDAGEFVITAEDIAGLLTNYNADATVDTLADFYGEYTLDTVTQ